MKRLFIISIALFIGISITLAQPINVKGKVADATSNELLVGALITFDKNKVVATDIDGNYTTTIDANKYHIKVSLIGYISKEQDIDINTTTTLDFKLEKSTRQLDQVVITAGKFEQKLSDVTVSMDVIKPTLVENKNTTQLDAIANQVPGVMVLDGQISIRGGSGFSYGAGSRVLVLVDEMPMLAADAGDIKWSFLPIENLEQIEVIKGASSALFGSSALNGVINIRTAYPKDKPETKITTFSGVYEDPKRGDLKWWTNANPIVTGANFYHSHKIGNLDLVVSGHVYSDQGYREGETEQRARMNLNLKYNFQKIKGLSIGINGNALRTQGGNFLLWQNADSGGYKPQAGTLSNYVTTRSNIDPFVTYYAANGDKYTLRTRYFNTTNKNNTSQQSVAELYYGEFQYRHNFSKSFVLNAGLVGTRTVILADSLYGFHHGQNKAIYLQADKRFWNKLSVSLGVRAEYFKDDNEESISDVNLIMKDTIHVFKATKYRPVARFGLNYQLFSATYIRASFGQGYRYPTVAEKYVTTSVGALTVFPNINLKPETGTSAEVAIKQGVKVADWLGFIDVAAFSTEYHNMMEFEFGVWFPDTAKPAYTQYAKNKLKYLGFKSTNVTNARINGFEVEINLTGKVGPFKLFLFGGYTYTKPIDLNYNHFLDTNKIISPDANVLKYRFYHNVKGDIQLEYKRFSTGLSGRYNSNIINIDNSFQTPVLSYVFSGATFGPTILPGLETYRKIHNQGSLLFDFRFGYQITDANKISIIVNNLMNNEVMSRPGDILPPRTWMVQLMTKF